MSYGLLQQGRTVKSQAMSGMKNAATLEQNRNQSNENIAQADKNAKNANAMTGATTGAMIGAGAASTAGLGAASMVASGLATGGIGLAAGLLLSELF